MSSHSATSVYPQGAFAQLADLQQLKPYAAAYTHAKKKSSARLAGAHSSRKLSRGMEFQEVRVYQSGDDIRSIDWRVTARTQTTHTKVFDEEKEKPVITLVDQRRSLFFGSSHCFKSVSACYLAALINFSTLKKGDRAGGILLGHAEVSEYKPTRNPRSLNQWLRQLSEASQALIDSKQQNIRKENYSQTEPSFQQALLFAKNRLHQGGEIHIISDFYDLSEHCQSLLLALSKHHRVQLHWVYDPLEMKLPLSNHLAFSDGVRKKNINIHTGVQQKVQQGFLAKYESIKQLAFQLGAPLNTYSTTQDLLSKESFDAAQ